MQAAVAWCTSASLMVAAWCTLASFIASMAWTSFKHATSSALSSSSLKWECIVALVVSKCLRAMFILSCSWRSSLVSLAGLTLVGVWWWEIKEMITISSVCGRVGWSSWGMVWAMMGVSPGVATYWGSVWRLPPGQGWPRLSPFAQGDLLLKVGPPGLLVVALSWAYYAGRQGWMLQKKFAAAIPGPPGDAGLWPWQCLGEVWWYQSESGLAQA